ncbi:hypothetical protein CFN78_26730 [Amycolatopsis antarctica]|uniref:Uncharacterized protein n=1 Tax=Amycolatopsis antarctica TaxID=1854586 RepID=A0A263CXV8_9PSEU|nr:hypothetical protein [Amycolatopsis antarctica]OZM70166.1 hypothetical protein CFN78_26730 [Amycolatopsis antarctica]
MPLDNLLGVALVTGLIGIAILVVLWPNERHGERLLRRWGVADPSGADVTTAVTYLRRRRFWYPWLFLGIPVITGALGGLDDERRSTGWAVLATLLLGALIAELLALRPSRQPRREAMLAARGIGDLVPGWGIALAAVASAAILGRLAVEAQWAATAWAGGIVLAALAVAALAVRRPASGRVEVDLALRARSARVAVGLGPTVAALVPGSITATWTWWVGLTAGVLALVALLTLTGGRRAPAAAR